MNRTLVLGLAVLTFTLQIASAQVDLTVILRSPVPARLSIWEQDPTVLQLIMTSPTDLQGVRVSFRIRDLNSNVVVAYSVDSKPGIPEFDLRGGQPTVRYGPTVVSSRAVEMDQASIKNAISTNSLPEGEYELCIRLLSRDGTEIPTSGFKCRAFIIVIPDPPTLLLPENNYVLNRDSAATGSMSAPITFVWTPVNIGPGLVTQYRFTLAPILQNQSSRDAIERNTPLLRKDMVMPNLLYTSAYPDFALYPTAVGFAWQVQALDPDGRAATRNDGKSEIFQFKVEKKKSTAPPIAVKPGKGEKPILTPYSEVSGTIVWGFQKYYALTLQTGSGSGTAKMVVGKTLLPQAVTGAKVPGLSSPSLNLGETYPLRKRSLELVQITTSSSGGLGKAGGSGNNQYKIVATATTSSEGKFSFSFLNKYVSTSKSTFTYCVRVHDSHFEDPPDAFKLDPGKDTTDLKLQSAARSYSLSIIVHDEDTDLPTNDAQVVVYRQSSAWDAPAEEGNIKDKSAYPYPAPSGYVKKVQPYTVKSYTATAGGTSNSTTSLAYFQNDQALGFWVPLYLCAEYPNGKHRVDQSFMNDPVQSSDYYTLVVTAPGHEQFIGGELESKSLATGQTTLEFTVKLKKSNPEIHGTISRADNGSPVGDAHVELIELSSLRRPVGYGTTNGILGTAQVSASAEQSAAPARTASQAPLSTVSTTQSTTLTPTSTVSIGVVPGPAPITPPNPFAVISGQDGAYSISNIPPKSDYNILVTKPGYKAYIASVTLNELGISLKCDVQLEPQTVEISGLVVDDNGSILRNAGVKSVFSPEIFYSGPDGRFAGMFAIGNDTLHLFKPGYYDRLLAVTIKRGGSRTAGNVSIDTMVIPRIVLSLQAASLLVTVVDSANHNAMKNASVIIGDSDQVGTTADDGTVFFKRAPAAAKLTIIGPEDQDYVTTILNVSLVVSESETNKLTVALLGGGRFTGTVRTASDNATVSGARIRVDGISGLETLTDNSGGYILRGVPPEVELTLKASKAGLLGSSKSGLMVSAGGSMSVDFTLTSTSFAINKLLGFDIDVDTLIVTGVDTLLTGSFTNLPNNPFVKLANAATRVPFSMVKIHNTSEGVVPDGNEVKTDQTQIAIRVFDQVNAMLMDENGLTASWNSAAGAGEIKGSIGISLAPLLDNIPGLSLVTSIPQSLKIPVSGNSNIPAITSNGVVPFAYDSLSLSAGSNLSFSLWNFELTVDLTKSSLKADGLHYYGSLKMPSIEGFSLPDLLFQNLHIDKSGLKAITVSASPPIAISFLGVWKAQLNQVDFSETGFSLGGFMEFTLPGMQPQNINFSKLKLSTTDFFGGEFNVDKINLFNITDFTVPGKVLTFGKADGAYFLQGSGKISLTYVGDLTIENFLVRTDGKLQVKVPINVKFDFTFLKVALKSLEFSSTGTTGVSLDIGGDIDFNIPSLEVKAGGFHFKPGGVFTLDELGISFTAGPVDVAVQIAFKDNGFEGKGNVLIEGWAGIGVDFAYTATLLKIEISVGVVIPVAPPSTLTITKVWGGIERNVNVWTVTIGGSLALSPGTSSALKADVTLKVSNGPVIKGTADITVANKLTLAQANLEINIPEKYVHGDVSVDIKDIILIPMVSARGTLTFHIESADFWYFDAPMHVEMPSLFACDTRVSVGRNYNRDDGVTINGIRVNVSIDKDIGDKNDINFFDDVGGDAYASLHAEGDLILNFGSYYAVSINVDFAAGIGAHACGLSTSIDGHATFAANGSYTVGNGWDLSCSGGVGVELHIGCSCGCNSIGTKYYVIPCGFKVCVTVQASAEYTSNNQAWSLHVWI